MPPTPHPTTLGIGKLRRAQKREEITDHPPPRFEIHDDPADFAAAFDLQVRRHGDSIKGLHRALVEPGDTFNWTTLRAWRRGSRQPLSVGSLEILARIEDRYRLARGYFRSKLANGPRATTGLSMQSVTAVERRRFAWHLPDDFDRRSVEEQREILDWVRRVIISGATEYRRFQALAMCDRYGLRFSGVLAPPKRRNRGQDLDDPDGVPSRLRAPKQLQQEMEALVRFKTSVLTEEGYKRSGVWNEATAAQKVEHFGLLLGAFVAPPTGRVRGLGAPRASLTLGLLVLPSVWDWYVRWREQRRGFYTKWETDMLNVAVALTRKDVGWLRQSPFLAGRLRAVRGIVDWEQIEAVRSDWEAACDRLHEHGLARVKEIERVARVHRDSFEPILPILEADSPLALYRAITEEILQRLPDEQRYPTCAAEAVRAFLMLRLGLHLGVRQKNLRQLLLQMPGCPPTPEKILEARKQGELRWVEREQVWEVHIPSAAFKNAGSKYFAQKPYRLRLPDLGRLYHYVDAYVSRHRQRLLKGAADPGVFFVKTVKASSQSAAYDQNTFYEAWRLTIARYGIYNPYTGRGVVPGLLPHGPHNLRDVLATHVLKKTGSYEQASYAIQDTPQTVAQHYGRFLPQDKAALAAKVLNKVWAEG